jgi:hypothetical protein
VEEICTYKIIIATELNENDFLHKDQLPNEDDEINAYVILYGKDGDSGNVVDYSLIHISKNFC